MGEDIGDDRQPVSVLLLASVSTKAQARGVTVGHL